MRRRLFLGKSEGGFPISAIATRFLIVILLVLIPAVLLAKGQGEERDLLAEAKMLFEEKRYDDARKILAEIIREDPEKFDAVEKIMEQIREVEFILNNKLEEIKEMRKEVEKSLRESFMHFLKANYVT